MEPGGNRLQRIPFLYGPDDFGNIRQASYPDSGYIHANKPGYATVVCMSHDQDAPYPARTTKAVRTRMVKSSHREKLSIY